MIEKQKFIAVGENIHCTRIYKVGGVFVKNIEGRDVVVYREEEEKKHLPVPPLFTSSDGWKKGNVKHAAVGIWQGMNGADEQARKAGRDYIAFMARRQEASGASYLDLNVDELSTDIGERVSAMQWAAEVIQSASSLPLSIDSSNLQILKAGLDACDKSRDKPMVNSVSLERLDAVEIASQAGAVVIAGASGETGMPRSKEDRLQNLEKLLSPVFSAGLKEEDVFSDPLVFPISVDPQNGVRVIEAVEDLRNKYGGAIHFGPGLSNVSFGMPNRKLLNLVFTWLCREKGLDGGLVDPVQINEQRLDQLDLESEASALARDVLTGTDEFGMNYLAAYRAGRI